MRKRRLYCFLLLTLSCTSMVQAQWDMPLSHYWAVRGFYNPAFAGATEQIRTAAAYRYEWAGIKNTPQKVVITADLPIEFLHRRHGAGMVFYGEQAGPLRNTLLAAQYNFRGKMGNGALQIGIQAGIYSLQFDAGSREIVPVSAIGKQSTMHVNAVEEQLPDLNAGIVWDDGQRFAGLSVLHITQPRFHTFNDSVTTDLQSDSARIAIPRSINFMAGYNIGLLYPLAIQPMVWIQSNLTRTVVQATLRLEYNKRFSGGFTWSLGEGYVVFGGTTFQDLEMGYAYNRHTTGPASMSKGSHELYLRYDLPLDYFKPKLQPHKSIRLL